MRAALLGLLLWCAAAAAARAGWLRVGAIELLFLLAPLVVVPLGFELLRKRVSPADRFLTSASVLCPFASVLVATSFLLQPGAGAAAFVTPWMLICGLASLAGLRSALRGGLRSVELACFSVAQLYLVVGGVWLLVSRLGALPMHFSEPIVLLTAVHFHYAGFALPILAGSVGGVLEARSSAGKRIFRWVAAGILAGPALVATGFVVSPLLKLVAVLILALGCVALAGFQIVVLRGLRSRMAKALLGVSAGSVVAGMALAGVYALGDYAARYWLLIPQMARSHGPINGIGFALAGLLAWSLEARSIQGPR